MKDVERRLWRVLQGKPNERQLMLDEWAAEMQQAPWSFVSQKEDEGKEMAPEWGTLMASLPDRLSQTEGFFSASVYTTFWAHEIWNTSLSDNARWPLHSASLVHHLLKRGHGETLCNAWTRNLIESDRKENNVQIILRSLDSASIESLLVLFIKSLQRARQTKDVTSVYKAANLLCTLIPSSNTLEDIDIGKEILVDRLLLGRLLSESPDTLHLLIHCIKLLDPSTLAHTLSRTIESWAHSYILEKQALTSQLNYSRVLLLLTGHAPRPLLMEFKIPLIQGVSMYLDQPNKETRNMGMIVAEAYSKACEDTMTLDFELKDLSHSLKELKKLSNPCSLTKPLQTHIETDIIHTSTTSKAPNTTTKPRKLAVDATVTSKTRGPRYLMDCLSDLKTGEGADPERLELALVAAPSLILTATDLLLAEHGPALAEKLVFLTNDFDLPAFEPCQIQALVCLLIRCPSELPRHLASLLYSKETGTMARMLILSALGYAALQLSSKKPLIKGTTLLPDTSVATVNGTIVRPPQTKVPFSQLVQYFFLPLIGPLAKWTGNDGTSITHQFLSKVLSTLGVIYMSGAAASPYVSNLARELYALLLSFRTSHPGLRTGVLEALLMLIETTPKSIFRHVFAQSEVEGLIEWMMDWAGETQGQVEQRLLAWVLQSIQKQISP